MKGSRCFCKTIRKCLIRLTEWCRGEGEEEANVAGSGKTKRQERAGNPSKTGRFIREYGKHTRDCIPVLTDVQGTWNGKLVVEHL